ncbi:uncharacterized protein LOC121859860 [Homarus americanus]|uniref:Putative C-type lectin-like 17 n=1 Tax=Homarus americanus TaxID=6706 RepID=A0A8J5T8E1_HOMAM|nr:uncharacterized protein LOC121859860 [Homarus americanus]KAG7173984.1 putative C-type lectin-like 17 [Homarus americanus]
MSLLTQVILATVVAFVGAQCPSDFFEAGGGCFAVIDQPGTNLTWDGCRKLCQDLTTTEWGVDLATFDDAEQLEAFSFTWLTAGAAYDPYPYMWIGVSKVDGEWEMLGGKPVSLQSNMWLPGHPHEMGTVVFLDDITLESGEESYGRQYFHCSMGSIAHRERCLCRAQ